VWFPYMMFHEWALPINSAVSAVLLAGSISAYALRRKHYALACWVLLVSAILGDSLVILAHPNSRALTLGVLIVVAANALLSTRAALAAATLMWGLGTLAANLAQGIPALTAANGDMLLTYYLTGGAVWLASRPLHTSIEWALAGWTEARKALAEARARRAELYRTVRALEEATYRIERMNNELLVAERDSQEARILKARFAATVSHELRAPLNLILGFSKLMALSPDSYGGPLPRAYRADVDAVYRNSQHLVALIDDILDLSQIEAQRLPLVKDRVDLQEDVIKKAVSIVQPLAERKGLCLRLEITSDLPWVLADPMRLRQALLNLLTNAIRFTERGGITVRAKSLDGALVVSVQDTGQGIASDDLPKLFQEFRQLQRGPTGEATGSGLGLSISKHLIELHGGQIWVDSQEKVGTTFSFSIPLPGSDLLPPMVKTENLRGPTPPGDYCLIVHDDARLVRLLAHALEGYRIVGLPDTQQLLTLAEQLHPRGILTTPELVESVRAELVAAPFDVPVLSCALPRVADHDHLGRILSYLVKPITTETVTATMHLVEHDGESTVLLVDDDPDAVRLLERLLTTIPRPYRILRAYDGVQALALVQETLPDIIFLDWAMPGMDGREVLLRLRADGRTRAVPVAIVSARDWVEDNITLGADLGISYRMPLDIARGAKCLGALLDGASPAYLPSNQSRDQAQERLLV
jgi:signal transduction histidine kinase/CheY-like chemotaxis protein